MGVFEELAQHENGMTSQDLADVLKLDGDALQRVLSACVTMDLLHAEMDPKQNGRWLFVIRIDLLEYE